MGKRAGQDSGHAQEEIDRLRELESFGILDTPPETIFDDLILLAAQLCNARTAVLRFVDAERQWFKARHGVTLSVVPRVPRPAEQTLGDGAALGTFGVCWDAPVVSSGGYTLGFVSVMDCQPRDISDQQRSQLRIIADQVSGHLEARRQLRRCAGEATARSTAESALREQQRILDGVLAHTDVLIYAKDLDGRFVMANPAVEQAIQVDGGLLGRTDHDLFGIDVAGAYRRNDRRIMATKEWQVFSEDLTHPDGSVHTYRSTKFPLIDDSGQVIGTGGVSTDVTELEAIRAAHAQAEQRWRTLVELSPAAVMVVDSNEKLAYANPEAVLLCRAESADALQGLQALDLVPEGARNTARQTLTEIQTHGIVLRARRGVLRALDGSEIPVEINATAVNQPGGTTVQLEVRDVSAISAAHAALKQVASTDPLTGLLNRRAWDEQVAQLRGRPGAENPVMTVAVVDLDNFKSYNDSQGHAAGDALLQRFSSVAAASLRRDDSFARWGGEEFVIALPNATPEQAESILHRVRRCVPFAQTCSIGYTAYRRDERLADAVERADRALYEAKSRGRNQLAKL